MSRLTAVLTCTIILAASWTAHAQTKTASPLPGTQPLTLEGDLASQMIDGVDRFLLRKLDESVAKRAAHWHRDLSSADAYTQSIEPNRRHLAHILGVRDPRVPFDAPQLVATTQRPALVARGEHFDVFAVRWLVVGDVQGEGLLLVPTNGQPVADVIALPDCQQTPEQIVGLSEGVAAESQFARRLAENGCRVIVPVLVNRGEAFPNLSNREYLYRSAFELGRHLVGYEVQKVLACVDWFDKQRADAKPQAAAPRIGVVGYGEGGMIALYAAALDTRIDAACGSGYFGPRESIWQQPIDRNVFGLLEQFGDAELAAMVAPRPLVIEAALAPQVTLPGGRGAPATLTTPALADVRLQFNRFTGMVRGLSGADSAKLIVSGADGRGPAMTGPALGAVLNALHVKVPLKPLGQPPRPTANGPDPAARLARQVHQIDRHNQALLEESQVVRQKFMQKLYDAVPKGLDEYQKVAEEYRRIFRDEVVGRFDDKRLPFNARSRLDAETDKWTRYEVVLDVFPDVFAYGLLIIPKDIEADEWRPVVVCQHGLEGRPQSVIGDKDKHYYKAFATELAEQGFVTFAPQNIYIFHDRFRTLQRKANPLGKTLFSIMVPQHQQITDWLKTLPFVDGSRIAFYGLSYGGKSAMRIPPLVDNYCLSICAADFNEWVWKNASTSTFAQRYTYANKGEYEIFEWDLGSTFNYAEMAALIAPRPFMVERGHDDGVAPDETVAYEYAKVRRLYDKLGIGDRTEIEFFNGPHSIHGVGTYEFLHRHLNWPKR